MYEPLHNNMLSIVHLSHFINVLSGVCMACENFIINTSLSLSSSIKFLTPIPSKSMGLCGLNMPINFVVCSPATTNDADIVLCGF